MQKVTELGHLAEIAPYMDNKVFRYIREGHIESFESFGSFYLLAFDWYDVRSTRTQFFKMLIYLDKEDIFFICRDKAAVEYFSRKINDLLDDGEISNEQLLYRFFVELLRGDMDYLDKFEADINEGEEKFLAGELHDALSCIAAWRRELLRLKHYYEQLDTIFDQIAANDNDLLQPETLRRLSILGIRTDRYLNKVYNLQEILSQMRETYQSQLSIQQNDLMKVFTVVTAVFLPLTLLVGWYGMNFVYMPELCWRYGYAAVIVFSLAIVGALLWYFRHKKWL